jgi:hypothetical protein
LLYVPPPDMKLVRYITEGQTTNTPDYNMPREEYRALMELSLEEKRPDPPFKPVVLSELPSKKIHGVVMY